MLLDNYKKQSPIIGVAGLGGGINSYIFLSSGGDYVISRSLRFDSGSSAYLSRTFSVSNRKTWTWSSWIKLSSLSGRRFLFSNRTSALNGHANLYFEFDSSHKLRVGEWNSSWSWRLETNALFRDASAWFHIVVSIDTTQSTASNRAKIYINGVEQTLSTSDYPSQNSDTYINQAAEHVINLSNDNASFGDFYYADVHFIDGQALAPTDFGATDTNGLWQPKEYAPLALPATSVSWSTLPSNAAFQDSSGQVNSGTFNNILTDDGNYVRIANNYLDIDMGETIPAGVKITFKFTQSGDDSSSADYALALSTASDYASYTEFSETKESETTTDYKTITLITRKAFRYCRLFYAGGGRVARVYYLNIAGATASERETINYGSNGFHLDFQDTSSNTALGFDSSSTGLNRIETGSVSNGVPVLGSMTFTGHSNAQAANLRDNDLSTLSADGGGLTTSTNMGYDLLIPYKVRKIRTIGAPSNGGSTNDGVFNIQYSDDGNTWTTVTGSNTTHTISAGLGNTDETTIDDNGAHRYWRLYYSSSTGLGGNIWLSSLDMFADNIGANNWFVNNLTATTLTLPGVLSSPNSGSFLSLASSSDFAYGTGDFTWEFYVKRPSTGGGYVIDHGSNGGVVQVISGAKMGYYNTSTGTGGALYQTGFGDVPVNVWTHLAVVRQSGTTKLYKNGTQTASQGDNHNYGAQSVRIGQYGGGGNNYWGGGISNVRIVKGTAVYTSNFTRPTTPLTNVTNTVLLCCQSSSSASAATVTPGTITVNGTVTPGEYTEEDGSGTDSLRDTPTNGTASSGGDLGGAVVGNYATLLPTAPYLPTLSNGNLDVTAPNSTWKLSHSSIGMYSGKFYAEFTVVADPDRIHIGIIRLDDVVYANSLPLVDKSWGFGYVNSGKIRSSYTQGAPTETDANYGATWTTGDVIGIAYDADTQGLIFYKNGASQGATSWTVPPSAGTYAFATSVIDSGTGGTWNFGQRAFAYPVSGYKSLNTANLPTPTIADGSKYFDTKLYTGNSGTQALTMSNSAMSPGFVWLKERSTTGDHELFDTVRGVHKYLESNSTNAESTSTTTLTSFDSNGFTLGSSSLVNDNNVTYAGWAWDAGSSNTTIAAGGLNSSAYNQSQTWSNNIAANTGSVSNPTYAFNGNLTNGADTTASSGSDDRVITATLGLTLSNEYVEVYPNHTYSGYYATIDGVKQTTQYFTSTNGWKIMGPFTGTLTSVSVTNGTESSNRPAGIRGIKVAGKILVDSGVTPPNVPSIASQVRASAESGFSIVSWTGTGANGTLGHGLNTEPELIIVKLRNNTVGHDWSVYSKPTGNTHLLKLNDTPAASSAPTAWNNTTPTSSVFTVGSGDAVNENTKDVIAYCFSPVEAYSSIGKYTGNASDDGPFVYTGHSVAWIIIKRTDAVDNWVIYDVARDTYNIGGRRLYPDLNNAESQNVSHYIDILSNGFKVRSTGGMLNASGGNYIYMSFASNPFQSARAR